MHVGSDTLSPSHAGLVGQSGLATCPVGRCLLIWTHPNPSTQCQSAKILLLHQVDIGGPWGASVEVSQICDQFERNRCFPDLTCLTAALNLSNPPERESDELFRGF